MQGSLACGRLPTLTISGIKECIDTKCYFQLLSVLLWSKDYPQSNLALLKIIYSLSAIQGGGWGERRKTVRSNRKKMDKIEKYSTPAQQIQKQPIRPW